MKRFRLIMALLLVAAIYSFAGQNDKKNKAKVFVDKLKTDIQLTDSQKVKLTRCTENYFEQVDNANLILNETVRKNALIDIQRAFQNAKDSILTPAQRVLQKNKIEDRKTKLSNKFK